MRFEAPRRAGGAPASSSTPSAPRFATGSRDRTVKIWEVAANESGVGRHVRCLCTLPKFPGAVTALDWSDDWSKGCGKQLLAIGTEEGEVPLHSRPYTLYQLLLEARINYD